MGRRGWRGKSEGGEKVREEEEGRGGRWGQERGREVRGGGRVVSFY